MKNNMSEKLLRKIYLYYGIFLSLCLVASGILLIISAVNIYNSGDDPYTVASISEAFSKIDFCIYITLGALALGAVLKIFFPTEQEKVRAKMSEKDKLSRLEKRLDKNNCDKSVLSGLAKSKRLILSLRIITAALIASAAIPSLIFVFNLDNFTLKTNESIMGACTFILPWAFISAGLLIALSYTEKTILIKQIELIRGKTAKSKTNPAEIGECKCCQKKREATLLSARLILLLVAIGLIVAGIANGGMADVLEKAINICTECIGLG